MEAKTNFDRMLSNKDTTDLFCEWFWERQARNGDKLIRALNCSTKSSGFKIRKKDVRY